MPRPRPRLPLSLALLFLLLSPLVAPHPAAAQEPGDLHLAFFQGWETQSNILHAIHGGHGPGREVATGAALGWRFASWRQWLDFELEGMLLWHNGSMSFGEAGAAVMLRWREFPWNHHLATTLAAGEGLSYVSRIPAYEGPSDNGVTHLLNLIVLELTLAPPDDPRWAFLIRVHHRSRAWGLYAENGESNFFTLGIRLNF